MSDDSRFRYRREDGAGQDGRRTPASPPVPPPARPVSGPAAPPRTPPAPPPRPAERPPVRQVRAPAPPPAAPGGADPLAELARLMDEQDAFAPPPRPQPRGTEPVPPRRDPSRIEELRAEAARLEALRAKQAAARQAPPRAPGPPRAAEQKPQDYAQERQLREAQVREAHARQLRQQQIEERREAARQELMRQEQARQAQARQIANRRELPPPDSAPRADVRQDRPPAPRTAPPRPSGAEAYEAETGTRRESPAQRPEPPAFLMAGRTRPATPGLDEPQALDPRQVAAAERAARVAARQDISAERPAYGADERARQPDPRTAAPQRRAPSLQSPPQRTLLTPPSTADRVDENGNSVRLGYGSLAHQRAMQQEREAQAAARPREDEFSPGAYREPPPPPRPAPAPAREEPAGKPDSANYAYSATRRESEQYGYDEYDDRYDPEYADDGYMPPHGEEIYDGEQRRRKGRRAVLAVAAGLAIVVLGTAGVFAYRMVTGGTLIGSGSTPPVIRADTNPSKIITPPSAPDPQQKMIYDRVGTAGADEQVLPREEAPVDVSTVAAPRATPPEGITPETTEPKRVRTLTVRADGTVVEDGGATTVAQNTESPLSEPEADLPAAASTGGNGFVVQVASQRSEADAQGSWKALQTRYPNLLSSYTASVKQVNLGERGIYYRAQVGPFASRDEANKLCQSLRAQGGDCVVNRE